MVNKKKLLNQVKQGKDIVPPHIEGFEMKITLPMEGVLPDVVRVFDVPNKINFFQLGQILQPIMGWWEGHLFEFEIPKAKILFPDEGSFANFKNDLFGHHQEVVEQTQKIDQYLLKYRQMTYTYDFGDSWEHQLELVKPLSHYPNDYPVVVSGQGACPPEDSGGVYGWLATYEAYKDPKNPDHDDAVEWLTESEQLPEDLSFDLDDVNQFLKARVKL